MLGAKKLFFLRHLRRMMCTRQFEHLGNPKTVPAVDEVSLVKEGLKRMGVAILLCITEPFIWTLPQSWRGDPAAPGGFPRSAYKPPGLSRSAAALPGENGTAA